MPSGLMKPLVVLAFPGMYLVYKITEFKRQQQEHNRRKVTERELAHLNHKIVSERRVLSVAVNPARSSLDAKAARSSTLESNDLRPGLTAPTITTAFEPLCLTPHVSVVDAKQRRCLTEGSKTTSFKVLRVLRGLYAAVSLRSGEKKRLIFSKISGF
ncbi:hypothetical protein HPB48_001872 [Haemaphysalis longicornis]|uniref:Uncharacterized protein n=1 Tax=Haemaphysalis longicornis TaxID=44386 RepID=A0A9J6G4G9_HAELO|nr:hypothetical protein HPB48_001872 [Haemaphysalis longicornis]